MSLYDNLKNSANPAYEYGKLVQKTSRAERILTGVALELSPVCNFSCPFCYARVSPEQLKKNGERILRFDEWKRFIDEFAEMNVSELSLTGGECMLHPDFEQIYRYAYAKGYGITVLSNSSCLTDSILQMFLDCPPSGYYTTLYGATPETYEVVCGSAVFYERVMANIRRLVDAKLEVVLQFTASNDNLTELDAVQDIANSLGVPLRVSKSLIQSRSCDAQAIQKNEIAKEHRYAVRSADIREEPSPVYITPKLQPTVPKGLTCGGGRCTCAINYKGQLMPCTVFDAVRVETRGKPISDCWKELVALCDEVPCLTECQNCIHRIKCPACQARHYNDTKEFGKPSPRLCYKCLYPEEAKEAEERFARDGYLRSDLDNIHFRKK